MQILSGSFLGGVVNLEPFANVKAKRLFSIMYHHLHNFNKVKSTAGDLFAPDKVCHVLFLTIISQTHVFTL
jgi:hypothetical protein